MKIKTPNFDPHMQPLNDSCAQMANFSHTIFSQTAGVRDGFAEIFAPSMAFNVRMPISKHMARLWVWLHLPGLSH